MFIEIQYIPYSVRHSKNKNILLKSDKINFELLIVVLKYFTECV